jgi:RNA polymerase sigma factor (sigma-70 family)
MEPTLRPTRADKRVVSQGTRPESCCPKEWDAFFRRYNPSLSRLCVRWARGHREDAQDLLAEAYLRAVCATEQGKLPADNPIAWLSTIIANLARDQQRARSRRAGPSNGHAFLETLCDPNCATDALLATRQLLSQTLAHVRALSPPQRAALLARSAGETYEAIAAHLGTSPANARKLVQTARCVLRGRLSPLEMTSITSTRRHSTALGRRAFASPMRR